MPRVAALAVSSPASMRDQEVARAIQHGNAYRHSTAYRELQMKLTATIVTVALVALSFGAFALQDHEEFTPAKPAAGHDWLKQLVGEWDVASEMTMGQGMEPMRYESRESVRSIGGLWTVAELTGSIQGVSMTALMTLGYDEDEKTYIGTWIDSMQTHLWLYEGTLDETGKVLTLEAEGPSFTDPSKTALYRDAIEIVSADHKVLTSSVQNADGSWMPFMKVDYKRKR